MSVRSAGKAIREARLKSGLTQEKLSEGICSVLSLSRIENEVIGVSPSTFQALMAKAGAPCEIFPVFASRQDFECFYTLKKARYYMDSWQLQSAYDELLNVQNINWANNKFYYQEWLLIYCKIQSRSRFNNHSYILDILLKALHLSKPAINLLNFQDMLLSLSEIELIISCAQEYLYLNQLDKCRTICTQIIDYLKHSQMNKLECNRLNAENAIVYCKYHITVQNYSTALEVAEFNRHQMVLDSENPLLCELTFLTSIGYYYTGNLLKAQKQFETAFYVSHAIESCYSTICKEYAVNALHLPISAEILNLSEIPYTNFPTIIVDNVCSLGNGIYDPSSSAFYFGDLIREIRIEKKLSQISICQGLCSKSKLSKIENNALQPSVALAEALLQRLGISERIFTFWGDEREQQLYNLKFSLIHSTRMRHQNREDDLLKFKQLLTPNDTLYLQFYLEELAKFKKEPKEKIQALFDALYLTIPNFDIYHIADYRLSHMELTLLNCISLAYAYTTERYKGNIICQALLEYMDKCSCDLFMKIYIFSTTTSIFCNALYTQKLYAEALGLKKYINKSYNKYALQFLGQFLFYYSQSLGECHLISEAIRYAKYCCAIQYLLEFDENSLLLISYFQQDFNITIN